MWAVGSRHSDVVCGQVREISRSFAWRLAWFTRGNCGLQLGPVGKRMSWQVAFVQGQKATSGHCICSQEKEARPCFDMSVSPISFSNTLAPWVATLESTRSHVKRRRIIEQSSACFVLQKWVDATSKVAPQGYSRLLQARFLGQPAITLRAGTWPGHLPSPGSAARRTRNNVCFPKQAWPRFANCKSLVGMAPGTN